MSVASDAAQMLCLTMWLFRLYVNGHLAEMHSCALQVAAHVPGTSQHKATHDSSTATGGGGSTMEKVKEHIPGTTEHHAVHGSGQPGMQTGYTTSGSGMGGAGAGGAGAVTGAGANQGLSGADGGAGNSCASMHSMSRHPCMEFYVCNTAGQSTSCSSAHLPS